MIRTFHYQITEQDKTTVGEYLRSRGYSHRILAELKRSQEGILCNGTRVPVSYLLQEGDRLDVCLAEETSSQHILPVPMDLTIVYEDEDILVVDKPADVPIHPSINNHENTLANGIAWYYRKQQLPFVYRCINRLDRDTSGLLIIAKNPLSASILSTGLKRRRISRTYLAIVRGCIKESGTVRAPIAREEGSALRRCVDFERGSEAVTRYYPLSYQEDTDLTLLSLRLETGKTHQIRVHMLYLEHPIIGDFLYNPDREQISRQALHSWKLEFDHPITGEHLSFQAPLPGDMARLFPDFYV